VVLAATATVASAIGDLEQTDGCPTTDAVIGDRVVTVDRIAVDA